MLKERNRRAIAFLLVAAFSLMAISPMFAVAQVVPYADSLHQGPYVDKLVYNVIEGDDQQVLALINNEADMIADQLDPTYLPQLDAASDVEVEGLLRNGYGHLTINCDKYPLNLTAFRRALAFALDKEAISDDVWDGESQPLDSCVPTPSPWTIEGQLPYTYYAAQPEVGNQLLDDAGFIDIDADGFREAPDASDFDILVEASQDSNIALEVGQLTAEALGQLGIDARMEPTDFYEYLSRVNLHGDFDIVFYGLSFLTFDVNWMPYSYASWQADVDYYNAPMWRNASFDSWIDQLLHSTEYEDVYEAAIEMQKIWVYEQPRIITYNNINYVGYRTDRFEGHVKSAARNLPNPWTNLKVHLKASQGGPWGGTFRIVQGDDIDTFNIMSATSVFSNNIIRDIWMRTLTRDDQAIAFPQLAESYIIETNAENPDVPVGHTRFTFDLIQNATWSDGQPITAEDVAFTMNYYRDGLAYGNPSGAGLEDLTAAYAASPYRVVIEFNTLSYWHISNAGINTILPKHIFEDIGLDGWAQWNPVKGADPYITSGPFVVSEHVAGEFTELSRREGWAYNLDAYRPTDPVTTGPGTTGPTMPTLDPTLAVVAGAVGAAVVILVGGYVLLRQK
ncbi:MAG: ABC transporter substrate-binding protein [Candidatus Thorarchaeota archaeon]|jgi:ABC-type transport system substrate-binding protein